MKKIAILGLGLMGGSVAKALRNSGGEYEISAFDKAGVLDQARSEMAIDFILTSAEAALDSDIIFICLPVDSAIEIFKRLAPMLRENQIITDVCGVKGIFYDLWNNIQSKGYYIGGHPMTGKEKGGYENSDPLLFENCTYILCDSASIVPGISEFTDIIHSFGAKINYLNSKVHDVIVASVSHLPQLLAISLINSSQLKDSGINFFDYAAGGFRDMTRIASSDFSIWDSVIRNNSRNIIQALDNFMLELESVKSIVSKQNTAKIAEKFESARIKRDEIPRSTKGFIHQLHDVFVFVKDEPGVLSKITTSLFGAGINIKDIELLKIREGTGGTFRLSFESSEDAAKASGVIKNVGFEIK